MATRLNWVMVKPSYCCWVCHTRQEAPEFSVEASWLPAGWRRVRRGYAGKVTICDECTKAGRKYQKDEVPSG